MDIELARTFLQVVRTGSLLAAADKLHVTQTAVTARIKSLESQLNCRLFERNKAGARLTADGQRFLGYASQLVQTWEAACRELPLPTGLETLFRFGAEISLGNPLVLLWATRMRQQMPALAVRAEVGEGEALQSRLQSGTLDAALVYQPDYAPGMHVEALMEEKLIQIRSTQRDGPYVYIDWGPEFRRQHDSALPQHARASLYFNLGPLALQYILQFGGSGYFRTRVVQSYLDTGVLERVDSASEFSYPVFLVCARKPAGTTQEAVRILRDIVREESDWSQRWDVPL
ncbi:LysR family transcriptional regulator [Cupriavidus consociatus]|uniref:LysR family transcriptional regulator n=1 Tax=Cupriavidus consociatus TaxID=2821357 RepID=UPI001AE2798D|nr:MULTISPECIES: LysR family transcriptional regulator [unclassified Cupriavidus]MBP0621507.1 LysR family transcriptional regulator [Cupriavidus sp. LEh25]MDK2658180.1 LysR family transcriptional regulator [Cupriavidus sp. LEh21]